MSIVISSIENQPVVPHSDGDNWEVIGEVVFSGNYTTGGDSTLAGAIEAVLKQVGQGIIQWVQVTGVPGFLFTYNFSTKKLQVFDTGASSGAAFGELAEGAYPAGITGAKGRVYAMGL